MGRKSEYKPEPSDSGHCPKCGGIFAVIDSRKKETYTRRRKKCENCGERVSTVEIETAEYDILKARAGMVDEFAEAAQNLLRGINPGGAPPHKDRRVAQMIQLYTIAKLPLTDIGRRYGISGETVRRTLKRNSVELRSGGERP